jgi:hypothetical protein
MDAFVWPAREMEKGAVAANDKAKWLATACAPAKALGVARGTLRPFKSRREAGRIVLNLFKGRHVTVESDVCHLSVPLRIRDWDAEGPAKGMCPEQLAHLTNATGELISVLLGRKAGNDAPQYPGCNVVSLLDNSIADQSVHPVIRKAQRGSPSGPLPACCIEEFKDDGDHG